MTQLLTVKSGLIGFTYSTYSMWKVIKTLFLKCVCVYFGCFYHNLPGLKRGKGCLYSCIVHTFIPSNITGDSTSGYSGGFPLHSTCQCVMLACMLMRRVGYK